MAQPGVHSQDDGVPLPGNDATARPRPRQATIAAILLMVFGLLAILVALVLLSTINDAVDHGESVNSVLYVLVYGQIVLSGAQIASGALVLTGKPWSRVLAVALCSVNILGGVVSLISGAVLQAIVAIAINGGLIGLLNRDDVRDWCS